MARVHLLGDLRSRCGDLETLEVDAPNVRSLIDALEKRCPELIEVGLRSMSVAIDGEVMTNADFESIGPDTEIHFLSALSGG